MTYRTRSLAIATGIALSLIHSSLIGAQDTTKVAVPDTTPPPPAPAPAPALPFAFSGVMYVNFQYGGVKGNRAQNRFDLERAYLNFRASAGEHDSVRITVDVFQQRDTTRDSYYRGWAARLKYAYVQYDYLRGIGDELKANIRLGMLQTVVIEREEQTWLRGLANVAIEQQGFFASSDVGVATTVAFPNKRGEFYATVTNGAGYTSREVDRFKDYAARLTLTPWANSVSYFKGLQISPWYLKGNRASDFARKRGTVLPVNDGLQKDRYGILVTLKDPRLSLGAQFARKVDVFESADTTRDVAPKAVTRTGSVMSLYAIAKPLLYVQSAPEWPLGVVLRLDRSRNDIDSDPWQRNVIAGLSWDFNKRTTVYVDVQAAQPKGGSTATDTRTWFFHVIANY
ncbi:MAG: hypothetical protein ABI877_16680 [Gemmatimonadaceae bacterium]